MTAKKLTANFNEIYGQEYVNLYRRKKYEGRIDRLLKFIDFKKSDFVLDVGCGSGFLADSIKDKIKEYTGIDTSSAFIKEAKDTHEGIKNIHFLNEPIEKHVKKGLKYDKIFLLDVSEHLTDEEFTSVIACCSSLLRSGGYIYIHTPNKDYFLEQIKERGLMKQITGHIGVRNKSDYKKLISKVGDFTSINFIYLNHY